MKVILKPRAQRTISNLAFHISSKGYPETVVKFILRLEGFICSLANFPNKYPVSRHEAFAKRKLRQAVFEKNYIILFKPDKKDLTVFNVIHAKRLQ